MPFNPYPTGANLAREHDAEDRDVADLVALRELRRVSLTPSPVRVGSIAFTIPTAAGPPRSCSTRWPASSPNIDGTAAMIRHSPLVLDEAA